MNEKHSLDRYENLSYYEYNKARKSEKQRARKKPITREDMLKLEAQNITTEYIWKYLLNSDNESTSVHQDYHYYAYLPKPHPEDVNGNEAQILIRESQRRFLQMIDNSIVQGQDVMHLDLNSAYLTALAGVKHSIKYFTRYPLDHLHDMQQTNDGLSIHRHLADNYFNIIKVRLEMPYDNRLHIFTPNSKVRYKGKELSELNIPNYGDIVQVRLELFISKQYNIDSWQSFTTIFRDLNINYKKIDVFVYDYIERKEMFDLSSVKALLEDMKTVDKEEKGRMKNAIVSFTGQLMNIDPGRRLIMLASAEEVMQRLYIRLSRLTTVYGLQIDAIYFEPFEWSPWNNPVELAYETGREVYRLDNRIYNKDLFSKLELWDSRKYKIKTFRLQEAGLNEESEENNSSSEESS